MFIDPRGEYGLAGAVYGGISGAVGGYITGGWKGAGIGAIAGGVVGLAMPSAAPAVAEAVVASILGQIGGNYAEGKDFTNLCNYDFWSVAGAGVAGVGIRPLRAFTGKWIGKYRFDIIGRPLNKPGVSDAPGKIVNAISEGVIVGSAEWGGKEIGDKNR